MFLAHRDVIALIEVTVVGVVLCPDPYERLPVPGVLSLFRVFVILSEADGTEDNLLFKQSQFDSFGFNMFNVGSCFKTIAANHTATLPAIRVWPLPILKPSRFIIFVMTESA